MLRLTIPRLHPRTLTTRNTTGRKNARLLRGLRGGLLYRELDTLLDFNLI
jgi:hypothetical protein